ncbi:MAG: hypothetical protein HYZ36_00585, partial [Pedosphaera parvula]|nr:hypothetical protein [Pedosphaera parvula]
AEHLLLVVGGAGATLPLIGLYFSLRQQHVLAAWILTAVVGLRVPGCAAVAFGRRVHPMLPAIPLIQSTLATAAGALLYRNLTQRRFAQLPA